MKKGIKLVLSILLVFVLIIIVDLVFLKINNKPLIYIKKTKEEQQMIIYNSLLYRVV